jgi:hypothetical protein
MRAAGRDGTIFDAGANVFNALECGIVLVMSIECSVLRVIAAR